jgi:UDP-glucose 4-epimerase
MRKNNVKKIVYSSSAAIYGELETAQIDESHPLNADSPYGVSKLAAEKMILAYSDIYNLSAICLRYFNIYGVNQRFDLYGNVIPIFAKRLFASEKVTIFGDGLQTRDFVNVKDVARANLLAAESSVKKGVYNLGSGYSITINELIERMQSLSNVGCEVVYEPKRPADVLHCKANISKVAKELNFHPIVDFNIGLAEYLSWFKSTLD